MTPVSSALRRFFGGDAPPHPTDVGPGAGTDTSSPQGEATAAASGSDGDPDAPRSDAALDTAPADGPAPEGPVSDRGAPDEASGTPLHDGPTVRASETGEASDLRRIYTRFFTDIYGTPDHERAYEHGHIDGTHRGDPDAFRDVIGHAEEIRRLEKEIAHGEAALTTAREALAADRADREVARSLDTAIATLPREAEHRAHVRDLAAREVGESQGELDEAIAQEAKTRDVASWANVIIYGLVTAVFLLGDLVVSKAIVSQVLQIKDETFWGFLNEQWTFATGVAMLAMIVKLGYERIVEMPYRHGEKRRFRWTVLVTVALTLLTLGLLGYSRGYFIEATSAGPVTLDSALSAADAAPAGLPWYILAAYVSTAVLFAIAGGVCGGVAVQAWHIQWDEHRPARRRLRAARERFGVAPGALAAAEQALAETDKGLAEAHARRSHLPPMADLNALVEARIAAVAEREERLQPLHAALHLARTVHLRRAYDSGHTLAFNNRESLEPEPPVVARHLASIVARILAAIRDGEVAEGAARAILNELQDAAARFADGTLSGALMVNEMARALRQLDALRAAGVSADAEFAAAGTVPAGGDGAAGRPRRSSPRPFVWARGEMGRLAGS